MKYKATDEEWRQLLIQRADRLAKYTKILAPCPVMDNQLWLIYRAMHKDSKLSMVKSLYRKLRAYVVVSVQMWWRLKVRKMDPEDTDTWL